MPTKNITIDNISPLINYQPVGAWSEGNSSDRLMSSYSRSTFTLCVDSGASATLSFNGTAIWLFGAKRGNHGLYNVTLDGKTTSNSGKVPDPGIFQQPLYSATNLENRQHMITLTNAGVDPNRALDFLDLDFITWQSQFGTDTESASERTIQDSDTSFNYEPQSAWNSNPADLSDYFGGSGHGTTSSGASVTFSFAGDTVQIFGTTGPNNAPYSVSLDGAQPSTYNGTKYANAAQVPIYYADNLGAGPHKVQIVNQPALSGEGLNIDYATVNTVPSVPTSAPGSKSLSGGAIAGIVIGILAVIGILVGIFFVMRRRRYAYSSEKQDAFAPQAFSNAPPAPPRLATAAPPANARSSASWTNPLSAGSQSYGNGSATSYGQYDYGPQRQDTMSSNRPNHYAVQNIGSAGGSTTSSGRRAPSAPSELSDLPNPHSLSPTSEGGTPYSARPLPPNPADFVGNSPAAHDYPPTTTKGRAPPLPSTASQSLSHIPETEVRANRMHVDGRPQDLGHVPVEGEMPPPDYSQATEPYDARRR